MLMPVEVYNKTEGKQWIDKKKTKGKLYIFYGKNCLHRSESEKLRLFRRYCEGTGKRKQEKNIKKEESNWRIILYQVKDNFEASEGKWRQRGKKKIQCK